MRKLEQLKKNLEMVELEERLEMVQMTMSVEAAGAGDNGCCTGTDSSCNPTTPPKETVS